LPEGTDLLGGRPCAGEIALAAYGVAIIEEPRARG
jgi:hypothetical protein